MEAVGGLFPWAAGLVFLAGTMHFVNNSTTSGNLGRNPAIGIRTRATKSSDAAWRAGHLAAGPWLRAAAWTGYSGGAVTVALALLLLTLGHDSPIALLVPGSATIAVIALVLIGTRKANQAGRAATSSIGVTRGRSK